MRYSFQKEDYFIQSWILVSDDFSINFINVIAIIKAKNEILHNFICIRWCWPEISLLKEGRKFEYFSWWPVQNHFLIVFCFLLLYSLKIYSVSLSLIRFDISIFVYLWSLLSYLFFFLYWHIVLFLLLLLWVYEWCFMSSNISCWFHHKLIIFSLCGFQDEKDKFILVLLTLKMTQS